MTAPSATKKIKPFVYLRFLKIHLGVEVTEL